MPPATRATEEGPGGLDEDRVEHHAARRIGLRHAVGAGDPSGQGERADVDRRGGDRRPPGAHLLIQQPPSLQLRAGLPHEMVGQPEIAGERVPVDEQHAVTPAREQRRRRRRACR
jgi:hypothetical protein